MATFRLQHNAPDVYSRKSRDFQLFCNVFDCLFGSLKYDIDSILDVTDTTFFNERLIPYLQTKLGFWTNLKISAESLRIILKGFTYAVRNKGSIKGVEQAVYLFLKVKNINTNVHVEVINEDADNPYTVLIGTEASLGDTSILDEILKYILPAGYAYRYVFYADTSFEVGIEHADSVNVITGTESLLAAIRTNYEEEYPLGINNVDATLVANNTVTNPSADTPLNTQWQEEILEDE